MYRHPEQDKDRYISGKLAGKFAVGAAGSSVGGSVHLVYQGKPGSEWVEAAVELEMVTEGMHAKLSGKISTNGCSQDDLYAGFVRLTPGGSAAIEVGMTQRNRL